MYNPALCTQGCIIPRYPTPTLIHTAISWMYSTPSRRTTPLKPDLTNSWHPYQMIRGQPSTARGLDTCLLMCIQEECHAPDSITKLLVKIHPRTNVVIVLVLRLSSYFEYLKYKKWTLKGSTWVRSCKARNLGMHLFTYKNRSLLLRLTGSRKSPISLIRLRLRLIRE